MSTETITRPVTFISHVHNQMLFRKVPRHIFEDGHKVGTTGPEEGESPWVIEFSDHEFTTDDPVLIEYLRNHELFNNATHGIWEQGRAPDEPKPTLAEQTSAIGHAAASQDVDALREILELEKSTHNRTPVIQSAESALLAIANASPESGTGNGAEPSDSPTTATD